MLERTAVEFLAQADAVGLIEDNRAAGCVPGLQVEIERLRSLPGVADALDAVEAVYDARLATVRDAYRQAPEVATWGELGRRFLSMAGVNGGS